MDVKKIKEEMPEVSLVKMDKEDLEGYKTFMSYDEVKDTIRAKHEKIGDIILIEGNLFQVENVPMHGTVNDWVSIDADMQMTIDSKTGDYDITSEEVDCFRTDGFTYYYTKGE